ncbi:hypothetical protein TNCV_12661 [Trichonephila clavipes]|nr:hypothetical protein TNCV_12661 [Trichonephila clavipes]
MEVQSPTAAWWGGWWELVRVIKGIEAYFRERISWSTSQKRPGKPGHYFKVGDVVMIEEPSEARVLAFRKK